MDRRERGADPMTGVLAALDGVQAGIYTAMPGIIQSFNPAERICTIQPTIKAQVQNPDGTFEWVTIPLLIDCPVIFPSGGGFTLTFPLTLGDECLVIFAMRCIDAWWQSGGVQVQAELRMHDISDGFVLAGVNSAPNVIPSVSTSNVQLRSDDGLNFYELDPAGNARVQAVGDVEIDAGGDVAIVADGSISADCAGALSASASSATVTAPAIALTGNVTITGNLAVIGSLTNNGTNIGSGHTHPILGGSSAPGPTGPPS